MKSIPQNAPVQLTFFDLPTNSIVTCLICGKELQRIGNLHLNMHNMTTRDYKAMFPDTPFISEAIRDNHRAIEKVKREKKELTGITKNCGYCGKPFYVKRYKIGRAKFCSKRCRDKGGNHLGANLPHPSGPDHPQWRGGHDKNYYGPNWFSQQRRTRERDNHICQMCGKTEHDNGRKLDVHHIKDFREFGIEHYQDANHLSNLVTLCRWCHSRITNNIAKWPPT